MAWNRKLKHIVLLLWCWCWINPALAQTEAAPADPEEGAYYWDDDESFETDNETEAEAPSTDNIYEEPVPEPSSLTPEQTTGFDKDKWKESTDGLNYSGEPEPEEPIELEEEDYSDSSSPSEPWNFLPFLNGIGALAQTLLIIAIIVVLIIVIYAMIRSGLFENKEIKQRVSDPKTLEELEDNIHESDLERALRLALEKQDYRMAIRIYYLIIIKELSVRNWIRWKRDKTNGEYVREMSERDEYQHFRSITIDFDRVWYGDMQVGESEYQLLHPRFREFLDNLKTPGRA